ncbi:MAG: Ig-like domain-containing protein, partial [Candidatus Thioglobus sp.]|uniref:Ig-like domain-containing protein n=1 Tax=Candidatus Thioglobus sp. TaxID=2026721 RepID=UPI0026260B41
KDSVLDTAGNTATSDIDFDALPQFSPVAESTINGAQHIDVRSPIVLTFSESVSVGTGNIIITDLNTNGQGWKNDSSDNTQTIDVTSSMVTIAGNIVTINPEFDFDLATNYEITFAAGTFTGDTSGQDSIAVESGDFTFTTVTPKTDNVGQESKIQVAGTDALVASNYWIDGHQSDPTKAPIQVDASAKDIAVAYSLNYRGLVDEDGHIQLDGVTDINDIIYGDVSPNLTGDLDTYGWVPNPAAKVIGSDAGSFGARTIYADTVGNYYIYSDETLFTEGSGQVFYG